MRPVLRAGLRDLLHHPLQGGLSILGIALGVALVLAIDIAIDASRRAFSGSVQTVSGAARHRVLGGPAGIPEEFYVALRTEHGLTGIAPIVEGSVELPVSGRRARLLGIDPWAERPFRAFTRIGGARLDTLLTRPGAALMTPAAAARDGVGIDDGFAVRRGGVLRELSLAGELEVPDPATARVLDELIVVDLATAQETLGMLGRLSAIEIADEATRERVAALLPNSLSLETREQRLGGLDRLTEAFRLNLRFLSLLALVVAAFLVHNTATFAVVRRREVFGRFRAHGAGRGQLLGSILAESLLLGVLGTGLGLFLGWLLGQELTRLVAATIGSLYLRVQVESAAASPSAFLEASALGLLTPLVASILPAREAASAAPRLALDRARLEERVRRGSRRGLLGGIGAMGLGGALLTLPGRDLAPVYLAVLLLVVGFALLTPALTALLAGGTRAPLRALFGPVGAMAPRGLVRGLSRTGPAVGALGVALAMTLGVGTMIAGFRETVILWLDDGLTADVYVTLRENERSLGLDEAMSPDLERTLRATPGIAASSSSTRLEIDSELGRVRLIAFGFAPGRPHGLQILGEPPADLDARLEAEDLVLVTEPFANRHGIGLGDRLRLRTPEGPRPFEVAGILRDYASDRGYLVCSRATLERHWPPQGATALAIFADEGLEPAVLAARLESRAGDGAGISARPRGAVRDSSLRIFDRTFAVTRVLRLLAGLVAFAGIAAALLALMLERRREMALLRAAGTTPRQVFGLVMLETLLLGLLAGLLSLPLGLALAAVLTEVVNPRSFGWSLPFLPSGRLLLETVLLGLLAAAAAGLLPALRAARSGVARTLRRERG